MTLSKQLIILITTIFLAIFIGNFLISINNIKSYLELESQSHAQDTATSLGLSISPYISDPDDPMIETMMRAIFDRGYYKSILLTDTKGNQILKLENKDIFTSVPPWFKKCISIKGSTATTNVSNGWMPGGRISVTSNPGYGYLKLYQQTKNAFIYAVGSFVLAMIVVLIFLRFILLPLKNIEKLATNIAKGRFETIEKLPWTTEIKNVATAMNDMSVKIEGIITKLNNNLETMNKKLKIDELTGLDIQSTFETDIKKMFIAENSGYVITAKIDELSEFAKHKTRDEVDNLIKDFALTLKNEADKYKGLKVYRFFGSEFAIIAENLDESYVKEYLDNVKSSLQSLVLKHGKEEIAHFGGTPFNPFGTTAKMLAAANEAYEKAKHIGVNEYYLREGTDVAKDIKEWKELVFDVIDNGKLDIDFISKAYRFDNDELFMEEAFTQVYDRNQNKVAIGTFVSVAQKYRKAVDLDKAVTSKVIEHIYLTKAKNDFTVNLSLDSLNSHDFKEWLAQQFNGYKNIASQIVFSVTAYGAAKDKEGFKQFIEFAHSAGAKVMLKRYESQFIPIENIKNFNLDYLRLAREYTSGISKDRNKKLFVESIKDIGDLLNIKIFAESVPSDNDYNTLKELNLFGASK